jgi:hypothetical protein
MLLFVGAMLGAAIDGAVDAALAPHYHYAFDFHRGTGFRGEHRVK